MGKAYDHLGNYNKPIECFQKAIELDPKYAGPWINMAFANLSLRNRDKAIECFRRALEIDPKNKKASEALEILLG